MYYFDWGYEWMTNPPPSFSKRGNTKKTKNMTLSAINVGFSTACKWKYLFLNIIMYVHFDI